MRKQSGTKCPDIGNCTPHQQFGYRSFVRNGIVQIPKFDTKPNPNHTANPDPME